MLLIYCFEFLDSRWSLVHSTIPNDDDDDNYNDDNDNDNDGDGDDDDDDDDDDGHGYGQQLRALERWGQRWQ